MTGFSSYTDAGTGSPKADGTCWWCFRSVDSAVHDFFACHAEMMRPRRERAAKRAEAKAARERSTAAQLKLRE